MHNKDQLIDRKRHRKAHRLKMPLKKVSMLLLTMVFTVCSFNLNGLTVKAATRDEVILDATPTDKADRYSFTYNKYLSDANNASIYTSGGYASYSGTFARLRSKEAFDLTDVTSITFNAACYTDKDTLTNASDCYFKIGVAPSSITTTTIKPSNWTKSISIKKKTSKDGSNKTPKDYTLDVSDLTGTYYICYALAHGTATDANTVNLSVKKVTLTRTVPDPPVVTTQPVNRSVDYGTTAAFSVVASNASSYQWYKNGSAVSGATNSTYSFSATSATPVYCKITGPGGTVTTNTVYAYINPPTITSQPTTKTVDVGSTVTFTIGARSVTGYQWYKNGVAVSGATGSAYSFVATASDHNVPVYCIVKGTSSTTSSTVRCLIANPESTVGTLPEDVSIVENGSATFSAQYKNTTSVQWIYSNTKDADKSTWTNVSGATSNVLTLNDVTRSMNGRYYALKLTGVNGTTAYSREAKLTVTEGMPEFITLPQSASVIEGRNVTFSATGNSFARSYQWKYKMPGGTTYTNLVDSTIRDDSEMFVSGAQSPVLSLSNVPLELHGMIIRCVITNDTKHAEADTTLKVLSKSMTGMSFIYPQSTVDFGSTIHTSGVYAIARYDSGEAEFMPNLSGLTFADGTTEHVIQQIGEVYLNVIYSDAGMGTSFTGKFKVNVEDKSAPVIDDVSLTWADTGEPITLDLSSDAEKKIQVAITAHDNYLKTNLLEYDWHDGNGYVAGASTRTLTSEDGNGIYTVSVRDTAENITEKVFSINAWDTEAPVIRNIVVTPDKEFAQYRIAEIYADDNVGLAAEAYSYDEGATWVQSNSRIYTVDSEDMGYQEGYPVQIRDKAGNVSEISHVVITGIDKFAPTFVSCEREVIEETDSSSKTTVRKVRFAIKANDDLDEETITYSCTWNKSPADIAAEDPDAVDPNATSISTIQAGDPVDATSPSNESGVFVVEGSEVIGVKMGIFTFRMEDAAGNRSEVIQSINLDTTSEDDYLDALDSSWAVSSTEWVNAETGVDLTCNIATTSPEVYNKLYPSYQFSKDTDSGVLVIGEQESNTYRVTENGSYHISMWETLGGEKISSKLYDSSAIEITNIDDINPQLESIVNEETITITASDFESGVKEIFVSGGEYGEGSVQFSNQTDTLNSSETIEIPALKNGTYIVIITDGVGNTNIGFDGNEGEGVEVSGRAVINPVKAGIGIHPMSWDYTEPDVSEIDEDDMDDDGDNEDDLMQEDDSSGDGGNGDGSDGDVPQTE